MCRMSSVGTFTVRHFEIDHVGWVRDWMRLDATDTRELAPSRQRDKHRRYAVREEKAAEGRSWCVVNGDAEPGKPGSAQAPYLVSLVAEGYLACSCPAGKRPPRRSTTTTVDPEHGSCVHRDLVALILSWEADAQRLAALLQEPDGGRRPDPELVAAGRRAMAQRTAARLACAGCGQATSESSSLCPSCDRTARKALAVA